MTGYQKKRILGIFAPLTAFILAIALMFTLLPVTAFADDTATDDDGTKDVTYTDEFSYDSAADWTTSQGYTATIGNAGNDAAISGLLVAENPAFTKSRQMDSTARGVPVSTVMPYP